MGLFRHREEVIDGSDAEALLARSTRPGASTHILIWLPEFLVEGGGWDFQTFADYDAGTPRDTWDVPDLLCDADPELLAEWAADRLGHPVILEPGQDEIRPLRGRRTRWHTVPLYFVIPAGDGSPW